MKVLRQKKGNAPCKLHMTCGNMRLTLLWRRSTYLFGGFQIVALCWNRGADKRIIFGRSISWTPQGIGLHSLFVRVTDLCFGLGTSFDVVLYSSCITYLVL